VDQFHYQTAVSFLFDDDYRIRYGTEEKSFADLLDILEIDDIDFARERIRKEKERKTRGYYRRKMNHGKEEDE
jgi:hypothetical protein